MIIAVAGILSCVDREVEADEEEYAIIISTYASNREIYAAETLQEYLYYLDGNEYPIIKDDQPFDGFKFCIGTTSVYDTSDIAGMPADSYVIAPFNNGLAIYGSGGRGTLYGVHTFLEDFCGYKCYAWYPAMVKTSDKMAVPEEKIIYKPYFEYRNTDWRSGWMPLYSHAHKLNGELQYYTPEQGGNIPYLGDTRCHTLSTVFCSSNDYFESHPEYFALHDGVRVPGQLCLTNDEVYEIVLDEVLEILETEHDPTADLQIISLSQADNLDYCECEQCEALDETNGSHAGSLITFVNRIAHAVKETDDKYDNVAFDTLAYTYTRKAPAQVKPEDNVIVRLCTFECCFSHSLDDPNCQQNRELIEDLEEWSEICNRIYIWDYTTNYAYTLGIFPDFHTLQKNMQCFFEFGVKGVYAEGNYYVDRCDTEFGELRTFLIAELMEDPYCKYEEKMLEFCNYYYGKGGAYVKEIIDEITDCVKDHVNLICRMGDSFSIDEEEAEKIDRLWTLAENAAADDPDALEAIGRSKLSWRYVKAVLGLREFSGTPEENRNEIETLYNNLIAHGVKMIDEWTWIEEDFSEYEFVPVEEWEYAAYYDYLHYNLNGGSNGPEDQWFKDEAWISDVIPTCGDVKFLGWSSDPEATEPEYRAGDRFSADTNITLYAVWQTSWPVYTVTAGADGTYTLDSGKDYVLTVKRNVDDGHCFEHFKSVDLDEETLTLDTDYTVVKGSTVVTIKATLLNRLLEGTHTVTVYFDDGKAESYLTVKKPSSPTPAADDSLYGEILPEDCPANPDDIPDGLWYSLSALTDEYYTGKAITKSFRVYDHKTLLKEGKDYTVKYSNNTKVSTDTSKAVITVTGKNNYRSKETISFSILAKPLGDPDVTLDIPKLRYNGKLQYAKPVLKFNGKTLKQGKDYILEYNEDFEGAYQEPGSYGFMIKGVGNFQGEMNCFFDIKDEEVKDISKMTLAKPKDIMYTGEPVDLNSFDVVLKDPKTKETLVKGVHYMLSLSENTTDIGAVIVTIAGIQSFYGTKTTSFKITGIPMSGVKINSLVSSFVYDGSEKTQDDMILTCQKEKNSEAVTLDPEKDYEVTYVNNIETGTATMAVTGKGLYTGTVKKTYKIVPYDIGKDVNHSISVEYHNEDAPYSKAGGRPVICVFDKEKMLKEGTDYTVSFKNNTSLNDGADPKKLPSFTVSGKGNYTGVLQAEHFKVVQRSLQDNIAMNSPDVVYSLKKNGWKSVPVLMDYGKKLAAGTDYDKNSILYTYVSETSINNGSLTRLEGEAVQPDDIIPAGTRIRVTVTGIRNYCDELSCEYRITEADISKASITVQAKEYTGKPVTLSKDDIVVKLNKQVIDPSNYEIDPSSYKNNINKGKASVTLIGVNDLGKAKTVNYAIGAKVLQWWLNLWQ